MLPPLSRQSSGAGDVARIVVPSQPVAGGFGERKLEAAPLVIGSHVGRREDGCFISLHRLLDSPRQFLALLLQKALGQQCDVFTAQAQGWNHDLLIEAVYQVVAELFGGHHRVQVAVCRRDHQHIDLDRPGRSDAPYAAVLQQTQQLHLNPLRQFPKLVEEHCPALSFFYQTDVSTAGAGIGPLLVSEQLAFDQGLRHRRAIYFDQSPGPPAEVVRQARHQILTSSRLPPEQDVPAQNHAHNEGVNNPLHLARPKLQPTAVRQCDAGFVTRQPRRGNAEGHNSVVFSLSEAFLVVRVYSHSLPCRNKARRAEATETPGVGAVLYACLLTAVHTCAAGADVSHDMIYTYVKVYNCIQWAVYS